VGRAERLVPQESSPEAANALLKLLEEPPSRALFVLTTAEPGLVLPTIRSRAVPLRMGRLDDADVRAFAAASGLDADPAAIAGARGSIGRLLAGTDAGRSAAAKGAAAVLEAIEGTAADRAALAMRQGLSGARGDFTLLLDALAERFAERAREAAGRPAGRRQAARAATAIERVMATREQAQGNVNPQLALAALAEELAGLEAA
jgi:DNA polymerase-3 subunit delta'